MVPMTRFPFSWTIFERLNRRLGVRDPRTEYHFLAHAVLSMYDGKLRPDRHHVHQRRERLF